MKTVMRWMTPENTTGLFPREAAERLEGFAGLLGIDLSAEPGPKPSPEQELKLLRWAARLFDPGHTEPPDRSYARLSSTKRAGLAALMISAHRAARELERLRPGTMLGFPKGAVGVNLIAGSWIDPSDGGRLTVFSVVKD